MKTKSLFALPLMALALSSAAYAADTTAPDAEKGKCHGRGGKGHHDIMKLDTNNDGAVSKEEFLKRSEEHFTKFDANKDGAISKDEIAAAKEKWKNKKDVKSEKFP